MICPKCDSKFQFDGDHCSKCGFIPTRHPNEKERKKTSNWQMKHKKENDSSYSYDLYTINHIRLERPIREVL